jgi:outer membrane protein assembly factor BamD (BamD/ComL family)
MRRRSPKPCTPSSRRAKAPQPGTPVAEPALSDGATSQLRQEAALLRRAREQLGRGALTEASSTLTESRVAFPESRLSQEREALTIELYVRQGRLLEARTLARVFLSRHPQSPHAAQVRRALATTSQE